MPDSSRPLPTCALSVLGSLPLFLNCLDALYMSLSWYPDMPTSSDTWHSSSFYRATTDRPLVPQIPTFGSPECNWEDAAESSRGSHAVSGSDGVTTQDTRWSPTESCTIVMPGHLCKLSQSRIQRLDFLTGWTSKLTHLFSAVRVPLRSPPVVSKKAPFVYLRVLSACALARSCMKLYLGRPKCSLCTPWPTDRSCARSTLGTAARHRLLSSGGATHVTDATGAVGTAAAKIGDYLVI
ncbi:hypothetical protein C8Q76DRAFT_296435 [Earliella scabrosa]|nr:hypothetical protein C8Q76DRAFT_296435 [Earliella scabrosa]